MEKLAQFIRDYKVQSKFLIAAAVLFVTGVVLIVTGEGDEGVQTVGTVLIASGTTSFIFGVASSLTKEWYL